MTEPGPGARQDRGRGGARLESAAYDWWFDTRWGRYAFTIELTAVERAADRLDGLRVLDAGAASCAGRPGRPPGFLTRRQLRVLGARHGQVKLHGTLVMPGVVPGSRHASCFLEAIGRRAFPATGAFQVLTIEKAA
jgi:hypothetical protein